MQIEDRPEAQGRNEVRDKRAREPQIANRRYDGRSPRQALATMLSTIRSSTASIGATGATSGIGVRPGRADSGRLDIDVEGLVEDLATVLRSDGTACATVVDETQDLGPELLGALITVQHAAGQRDRPFCLGAGLPNLPTTLSAARTCAERLFDDRVIGPLSQAETGDALSRPGRDMGAGFVPDASSGVVTGRQGVDITSRGPTRAQLIAKGLVYAPEHGRVAFTVPGMAGFTVRQHED